MTAIQVSRRRKARLPIRKREASQGKTREASTRIVNINSTTTDFNHFLLCEVLELNSNRELSQRVTELNYCKMLQC